MNFGLQLHQVQLYNNVEHLSLAVMANMDVLGVSILTFYYSPAGLFMLLPESLNSFALEFGCNILLWTELCSPKIHMVKH